MRERVKFHGKKFGSHSMTVIYPNRCYKEVCYKGTALYMNIHKKTCDIMANLKIKLTLFNWTKVFTLSYQLFEHCKQC